MPLGHKGVGDWPTLLLYERTIFQRVMSNYQYYIFKTPNYTLRSIRGGEFILTNIIIFAFVWKHYIPEGSCQNISTTYLKQTWNKGQCATCNVVKILVLVHFPCIAIFHIPYVCSVSFRAIANVKKCLKKCYNLVPFGHQITTFYNWNFILSPFLQASEQMQMLITIENSCLLLYIWMQMFGNSK